MAAIYEVLLNLPIIQNCHLPAKSGTSPLADAIKNGYGTMDGTLEIKPNSMFSRLALNPILISLIIVISTLGPYAFASSHDH